MQTLNKKAMYTNSVFKKFITVSYLISIFFTSLFVSSVAKAHEIQPAIVDFSFDKTGVYQFTIQHNIEALLAKIGSTHDETEESENSIKYEALRQLSKEELMTEFEAFAPEFLEKMQLSFNNEAEPLKILDVTIPETGDIKLARESTLFFAGIIPEGTKDIAWEWDKSFGNAVLRISSGYNPDIYSAFLTEGKASDIIPIQIACYDAENANSAECNAQQSTLDTFKNYIYVGFDHIVPKGLDHILFVVGLFLLTTQLKPLLVQVTMFTVAHSITLALGIFGIIALSAEQIKWVEVIIAASILYVCIENIFLSKLSRWRPILIFVFGLLHGLGFSIVLKAFGLSSENYITGLVAFNIGVEIGQLAVLAVCFLLVGLWFRNKPWYRKIITIPASIMIALIAVYWVLERTEIIGA